MYTIRKAKSATHVCPDFTATPKEELPRIANRVNVRWTFRQTISVQLAKRLLRISINTPSRLRNTFAPPVRGVTPVLTAKDAPMDSSATL